MKKISTTESLLERLRKDEKYEVLNQDRHLAIAKEFNEFMKIVKSDLDIKERRSMISASKVHLTA